MLRFLFILTICCSACFVSAEEKVEQNTIQPTSIQVENNYTMAKESLQYNLNEANEKIVSVTEPIKHSINKESLLWVVFWLLVGLVTLWVGIRTIHLQADPDIRLILENPKHLLNIPVSRLENIVRLLTKTRLLNRVLDGCNISEKTLRQAISFNKKHPDNIFYVKTLQERLGNNAHRLQDTIATPFYELVLSPQNPLPFHIVHLYFPSLDNKEIDFSEHLFRIVVIITTNAKLQARFNEYRSNRSVNIIVPNLAELTQLLLSEEPLKVLSKICAEQLHIGHISPYQTEAGVYKDMNFFGRGAILRRIMTPPIKNYLICGGRQLGKSSLLKAIERSYKKDKKVKCYYIILAGNIETSERDLVIQFANVLGLQEGISFNDVVHFLKQPRDFTYIFLIDEVDTFICHDRLKNYPIIRNFLSLSQTSDCFFMFGGFWELYTSIFLESLSPLKNFGEFVPIAGLEESACQELITIPMKWLGIDYENKELPFKISKLAGGRANLVTSMCHEILQLLPPDVITIDENYINKAANSSNIHAKTAMSGGKLIDKFEDAQLDRMIVYMCAKTKERLNNNDIRQALAIYSEYHYTFPQFEQSLKRLELAYILKRNLDDNRYDFCVPLFIKQLREVPLDEVIELEILEFKYAKTFGSN